MLKRHFIPYIVGACLVALFSVCYIGYRVYQNHIKFNRFISDAQAYNRSIEKQDALSSKNHTQGSNLSELAPKAGGIEPEHKQHHPPHPADGKYVYEVAGVPIYADSPMSQEDLEMEEWLITGRMTPTAEEYLKNRQKEEQFEGQVIQRVVDPDGKIHTVLVPVKHQYKEGDAILPSELNILKQLKSSTSEITATISINGIDYDIPEAYYAIENRYERAQYQMKFIQSKQLGISMTEADRMVETGEIDLSLSEDEKRRIDKETEADARHTMLGAQIILPPTSDNPPVKISFLTDESEGLLPGWMRKLRNAPWSRSGIQTDDEAYSVSSRNTSIDIDTAPVDSVLPHSPSDLSPVFESKPPPRSGSDLEKRLAPAGIEAELNEALVPNPADKVQQFIDEYGTEEGLRRLREADPDAARQFEREYRSPTTREIPDETKNPTQ